MTTFIYRQYAGGELDLKSPEPIVKDEDINDTTYAMLDPILTTLPIHHACDDPARIYDKIF